MKNLNKMQQKRKAEVIADLAAAHQVMQKTVLTFNEVVKNEFEKVDEVVVAYNAALESVREFLQSIVDEQQNYFDNKSEKWQRFSERGHAYSTWKDEWEGIIRCLEDVEIEMPEEVEEPDYTSYQEQVDELLDEPGF